MKNNVTSFNLDIIRQNAHDSEWNEKTVSHLTELTLQRDKIKSKFLERKQKYLDLLAEHKKMIKTANLYSTQDSKLYAYRNLIEKLRYSKTELNIAKSAIRDTLVEYTSIDIQIAEMKYQLKLADLSQSALEELHQLNKTYEDYVTKPELKAHKNDFKKFKLEDPVYPKSFYKEKEKIEHFDEAFDRILKEFLNTCAEINGGSLDTERLIRIIKTFK